VAALRGIFVLLAQTIPIIVKDTTSIFWQTVFAGARKAGQDFGANIANWVLNLNPTSTVRSAFSRTPSRRTRRRSSSRPRSQTALRDMNADFGGSW
jgi:hypothetical protein